MTLQVLPLDGHQVAVRLEKMDNLFGDAVSQPQFLQLTVTLHTQMKWIAASTDNNVADIKSIIRGSNNKNDSKN